MLGILVMSCAVSQQHRRAQPCFCQGGTSCFNQVWTEWGSQGASHLPFASDHVQYECA